MDGRIPLVAGSEGEERVGVFADPRCGAAYFLCFLSRHALGATRALQPALRMKKRPSCGRAREVCSHGLGLSKPNMAQT